MKTPLTIILTGGGSGGHITPLLSLAHALKAASPGCRVIYIGQKNEQLADRLKARFQVFDEVHYIPAGKFRRYYNESLLSHLTDIRTMALNVRDLFRTFSGIGYARKLLRQIKPDVIFCKGGFVGVPVGLAARLQNIPVVTHDSDTVPGLANRIVGRFAMVHATGMPAEYYQYPRSSIEYVGIPLDERIKPVSAAMQASSKKAIGLSPDSMVLLIGGAGLGAKDVNNLALAIAPELLALFSKLHIIHFAGHAHEEEVAAQYKAQLPTQAKRVQVLGFTPDFYKYTAAADLVISRAGATTIAELAAQQKAVILIPAPHLTGGHQLKNAQKLREQNAVLVVDNSAKPEELLEAVTGMLGDDKKRRYLATRLGRLSKTDAADKLAKILIKIASTQRQ